MGDQEADLKFDSQRIQPSNNPRCKTNKTQQNRTGNTNIDNANSNVPDYFKSGMKRATDKRVSQLLIQKYTMNVVRLFFRN